MNEKKIELEILFENFRSLSEQFEVYPERPETFIVSNDDLPSFSAELVRVFKDFISDISDEEAFTEYEETAGETIPDYWLDDDDDDLE